MTSLAQITAERAAAQKEAAEIKKQFEADNKAIAARLARLDDMECQIMAGFDPDRIAAGRSVLRIEGQVTQVRHGSHSDQNRSEVRTEAVEDAKRDVASGGTTIRKTYFGVKNYGGFGDQREDHKYGFGPRHGSIVFSIGLQPEKRKRLCDDGDLTEAEKESAIYLLNALPAIERQRSGSNNNRLYTERG